MKMRVARPERFFEAEALKPLRQVDFRAQLEADETT
jgi:hypothetical protein